MKIATRAPTLLAAAIGLFSATDSQASCQNHCVRAYKHCLSSDGDLAACQEQLSDCLAECDSRVSNGFALKGEEPRCAKPVQEASLPLEQPNRPDREEAKG